MPLGKLDLNSVLDTTGFPMITKGYSVKELFHDTPERLVKSFNL